MGASTYTNPAVSGTETLMSTDLNTLGISKTNVGAVEIDNTANRYYYGILELTLASADLSGQTNPAVSVYLIPSYDGTNFADTGTDDSTTVYPPQQYLICVMGVAETVAAHRAVSPHLMIDPIKYKVVVINDTNVNFASSGNTLKIKTYTATSA